MEYAFKITDLQNINYIDRHEIRDTLQTYTDRRRKFENYLLYLARRRETEVNGDKISEIFFPIESYDFFISHSHADRDIALYLKQLCERRSIYTAFVDSVIWFDVDKIINSIYDTFYREYDSTIKKELMSLASNAYIMLATALNKTIYNSNNFVFLDTNNSLPIKNGRKCLTYSPWLKLELETCKMLLPPEAINEAVVGNESITASVNFTYSVEVEHLKPISFREFKSKLENYNF